MICTTILPYNGSLFYSEIFIVRGRLFSPFFVHLVHFPSDSLLISSYSAFLMEIFLYERTSFLMEVFLLSFLLIFITLLV